LRDLQEPRALKRLLSGITRAAGRTPVLVKLAPDLSERALLQAADVALTSRCQGLILTNTTLSREGLPAGAHPEGGLSGRPLFERSTALLALMAKKLKGKAALIASGGVFEAGDVRRKLDAGADLVQVYTGFIYQGPGIAKQLCKGLNRGG
jgi:dihydroorotate dehydrogenase